MTQPNSSYKPVRGQPPRLSVIESRFDPYKQKTDESKSTNKTENIDKNQKLGLLDRFEQELLNEKKETDKNRVRRNWRFESTDGLVLYSNRHSTTQNSFKTEDRQESLN